MKRGGVLLLIPALTVFCVLLVLPLVNILLESFREYTPGLIGAAPDAPFTLENYTAFFETAYLLFFYDTYRIGLMATLIGLGIGYPIAYYVARQPSGLARKLWIGFLVEMMFLSVLVRVYSISLTFGPVGFLRQITALTGLSPASPAISEMMIIAALLHYMIPIAALTLIGTVQNVNPRLAEAAQALGAAALVVASNRHPAAQYARYPVRLPHLLHARNQRLCNAHDPRQRADLFRLQPGLQPVR